MSISFGPGTDTPTNVSGANPEADQFRQVNSSVPTANLSSIDRFNGTGWAIYRLAKYEQGKPYFDVPDYEPSYDGGQFVLIYVPKIESVITFDPELTQRDLEHYISNDAKLSARTTETFQNEIIDESLYKTLRLLQLWLNDDGFMTYVGRDHDVPDLHCVGQPCSSEADCAPLYDCLLRLKGPLSITPIVKAATALAECLTPYFSDTRAMPSVRCPFDLDNFEFIPKPQTVPCSDGIWSETVENWINSSVDTNIQTFLNGGADTDHIWWQATPSDVTKQSLVAKIAAELVDVQGYECSLQKQCPLLDCRSVGSIAAMGLGHDSNLFRSKWGFLVVTSLFNLNSQIRNQWIALQGVTGHLALDDFTMSDFVPKTVQNFPTRNALIGIATFAAAASGFIPTPLGPGVGAAGAILSALGAYYGNRIGAAIERDTSQQDFAKNAGRLVDTLIVALQDASDSLFLGHQIDDRFNVTDIMKGGAWVGAGSIPPAANLSTNLHWEILSRSINALWKQPSGNKTWVTFVDLDDDASQTRCNNDHSGPPAFKYCDDGGVYYAYTFVEHGWLGGWVDWPWGAQKMADYGIQTKWVTEASVKLYKLAKKHGLDPFDIDPINQTRIYLEEAVDDIGSVLDLTEFAGRYPGTWSLPVCNASSWGKSWNWDYTTPEYQKTKRHYPPFIGKPDTRPSEGENSHPPCFCGSPEETVAWAKAAGMYDFKTFQTRCKKALEEKTFLWPPDVESISFPGKEMFIVRRP